MEYLVAYDITEPKRLRRICKILEAFGTREQFSVFRCPIQTATMLQLWGILQANIDPETDRISAYPLDSRACSNALRAGAFPNADLTDDTIFIC